ncbi:hypothetical protein LCGC14_1892790 [marine sediment metagenome]|uniref:Uncharacterized protein n=1 Tax=marine sediment metagenome TaxID=412755 RepID=A0A0F9IX08_9ZZZZ
MMGFDLARILASPEGLRLYNTLKRIVEAEGMSVSEVLSQTVAHMEKIESLSRRKGLSARQVADDSLAQYERSL